MADDAKALSQDDIDALLNSLGGSAEASAPSRPAEAPVPPGATGASVDQAELDRLLASLDEAPPGPPSSSSTIGGPLGQEDIDALVAALGGTDAPADPVPATPAPAPAGNAPMGQDDIDALLNAMAPAAAAPATPAPPPAGDAPMGQDDIDALLNAMAPAATPAPAPAPAGDAPMGQDDIDALLNAMAAPPAPAALGDQPTIIATPAAEGGGQLGQTDIDALVNAMQTGTEASADPRLARTAPADQETTPGLTSDVVDALVAKHAATSDEEGDGMIAQSDIDALVKSLGVASGDAPKGAPASMTEQLAKHDDAIDQLLAGAAGAPASAGMATMDAIDVRAELGKGGTTAATPGTGLQRGVVVAGVPVDLRGARWMLLAAVLLLSVCCGTLVVVAGAVKTLASELKAERTANLAPTDDYSDDFKAALLRLGSPQDEEVAKGVLFLQRLKKRYPTHEAEIGLELARHFRSRGSWREARREYATIIEESADLQDDPRVHLEYAETLARVKERTSAIRQVNLLLANEAAYTGEKTREGLPRPQPEVATNRATLQSAQLLLGRLLAEDDGRRTVAARTPEDHGAAGHGAAPAAHGHGEEH